MKMRRLSLFCYRRRRRRHCRHRKARTHTLTLIIKNAAHPMSRRTQLSDGVLLAAAIVTRRKESGVDCEKTTSALIHAQTFRDESSLFRDRIFRQIDFIRGFVYL